MNRNRLYILVLILSLAGYVLIGYNYQKYTNYSVNNSNELEVCMFKSLTGLPCPSCGSTRSVTAIAHFDFFEALWWNPLGIIMSGAMILFPGWIIVDLFRKSDSFYRFFRKVELYFQKRGVAYFSIFVILLIWAWNIYKYL
jgi:hypothetical protein